MQTANNFITDAVTHTQQALERMPIRSSFMARQMMKASLPVPETHIERYVHDLLAGKAL